MLLKFTHPICNKLHLLCSFITNSKVVCKCKLTGGGIIFKYLPDLPEKGVSTKAESHIQNMAIKFQMKNWYFCSDHRL